MISPCPYCGLENDIDHVAEGCEPFDEGDVLICDGCGGVQIATGVLWETRLPTANDPDLAMLRDALALAQRQSIVGRFARRLGPQRTGSVLGGTHRDPGAAAQLGRQRSRPPPRRPVHHRVPWHRPNPECPRHIAAIKP